MSGFLVIGGGVNGLAAALEIARAGKKVRVLERRDVVGGLSARRKFGEGFEVPGIRHDTNEIRPGLVDSLGLATRGVTMLTEGVPVYACDSGDGIVLHDSAEASREEISRRSKKDADAYVSFRGALARLKPVIEPLLAKVPPRLLPDGVGEMAGMGVLGLKLRGLGRHDMTEVLRAAPMAVADVLREQFQTELISATLAFPAVAGDFVGPWSPGTAAMLILRDSMLVPGVKGGPAAVVDALVKALAEAAGSETIRTKARVTRINVVKGKVTGVTLEGGETIAADVVIASCSPKLAMSELLPPLSLNTHDSASALTIRSRGTLAKIHLGLSEAPSWRGRPGKSFERVRVGGAHLDDLERAFDAAKYRQLPAKPVLDVLVPAGGKPVLSILASAVPYDLTGGWTAASKAALLESVIAMLETASPGIRAQVTASEVLSPVDLESELGIPGGSLHHVERALDQMVFVRPARPFARAATPIEGLFLGSSGCHPGPGVTLAPGVLAARAALG